MQADLTRPSGVVIAERHPIPEPSLSNVLATQMRVTGALMMREIYTRFGRDNIGFAWVIAEPALFATAVIILWSIMKNSGHADVPIVPFVLTGYMPLLTFRHMTGRLQRCMQANAALLYHRQITIMSLYASRICVEILGMSGAFVFCMTVFYFAGYVEIPDSPALMLWGWLLYGWFAASISLLVGALSERSELSDKIWNPISYIMIPLSGTFYMVHWLPYAAREAILWMPPVNGVEMIRGGYFGPAVPTYFDISYLIYVNSILTVLGLYFIKDVRQFVEVE